MAWIKGNRYLSQSEMENNALLIYEDLTERGWSVNAIAAILGNMQSESTINPGIWQSLIEGSGGGGGYGLVQWTPWTNFTNWADNNEYAWDNGNAQLKWIDEVTISFGQWIPTSAYDISFASFKKSNESTDYLASAFLKNFERAGVEVESERRTQAKAWLSFLKENGGTSSAYVPRMNPTTPTPIDGNPCFYDHNPFHIAGYGLPNCTTYAYGRWCELLEHDVNLPTGDAGTWFPDVVASGVYETGQTPKLGAVICWKYLSGAGHVAIVEQINDDGSIVTSNSGYSLDSVHGGAWKDSYFYLDNLTPDNDYYWSDNAVFQGFIYLPKDYSGGGTVTPDPPDPPEPPTPTKKKGMSNVLKWCIWTDRF